MTHPTVIKLHDGNLMPQLGLGVWKAGNEEVVSAIHKALEVGYRSFDTAARGAEREPQQTEAGLCGSLFNPLAGTGYRPLRRGLAGADRAAAAGADQKHWRV